MSCPNCVEGFVLPGEPSGRIEDAFLGAYLAPNPSAEPESQTQPTNHALIFLTDGFGLPLNNCKLLADRFALALKCDVWVPDYFAGKPLIPVDELRFPDRAGVKMTIMDWVKFILFTGIPSLPAFIRSRPSVADKRIISFIELVKEKKSYTKIGMIGYCYGGSAAIRFAGTGYIDSAVICHPGSFSISQVDVIRVPTSWACAEEDVFFPQELRLKAEASLAARKETQNYAEYEFQDYPGTAHGFAARPNINLPEIKEAHEKAFEQAVQWFLKTICP